MVAWIWVRYGEWLVMGTRILSWGDGNVKSNCSDDSIPLLTYYWSEMYYYIFCYPNVIDHRHFNIHFHNKSPATGISFCKNLLVKKCVTESLNCSLPFSAISGCFSPIPHLVNLRVMPDSSWSHTRTLNPWPVVHLTSALSPLRAPQPPPSPQYLTLSPSPISWVPTFTLLQFSPLPVRMF